MPDPPPRVCGEGTGDVYMPPPLIISIPLTVPLPLIKSKSLPVPIVTTSSGIKFLPTTYGYACLVFKLVVQL